MQLILLSTASETVWNESSLSTEARSCESNEGRSVANTTDS